MAPVKPAAPANKPAAKSPPPPAKPASKNVPAVQGRAPDANPSGQKIKQVQPAAYTSHDVATVTGADDLFDSQYSGFQHVTSEDRLIPRMTIIQSLSPERRPDRPEYNEDAKEGLFCDKSTGELFEGPIGLIPCYYARYYLEWLPDRGGLHRNHGMDSSVLQHTERDDKNRLILPSGNIISETPTYFCLNMNVGGRRCFVPLTNTQIKNAKRWMNLIEAVRVRNARGELQRPNMYYMEWLARSVDESNNEGFWKGWNFTAGQTILDLDPSQALLKEAVAYCKDCVSSDFQKRMADSVSSVAAEAAEGTIIDNENGQM